MTERLCPLCRSGFHCRVRTTFQKIAKGPNCEANMSTWECGSRQIDGHEIIPGWKCRARVAEAEVERLREELRKLGDHPAVMAEGGTSDADRAVRLINKLLSTNCWWDDRHLECAHESLDEAVDGDEHGDIIELRPLHELPLVYVLVQEDGYRVFDSREAAEAAVESEEKDESKP